MKITKAKLLSKIEDELSLRYDLDGEVWIATKTSHKRRSDFAPEVTITYNNFIINDKIDFNGLYLEILRDDRIYGVPVLDEVVHTLCQSIALKNCYYFDKAGVLTKKVVND